MANTRISNETLAKVLVDATGKLEKKLEQHKKTMEAYTQTIQSFLDLHNSAPEQIAENRRAYEKQAIENIDKTVDFFKSMHPLNYVSTDVEILLVSQCIEKLKEIKKFALDKIKEVDSF